MQRNIQKKSENQGRNSSLMCQCIFFKYVFYLFNNLYLCKGHLRWH